MQRTAWSSKSSAPPKPRTHTYAHSSTNTHHPPRSPPNDPHGVPARGCGLPLGSSPGKNNECSQDRHACLPPSAVPPSPSRSARQTTPPYTTFSLPPPHIPIIISCTAIHLLIASCRPSGPGFFFHLDRAPLVIHFARQRSGTARLVFICMSSSGHRISRKPRCALTWWYP